MKIRKKGLYTLILIICMAWQLTGCAVKSTSTSMANDTTKIVATSVAAMEICEKLNLPLAGVPTSSLVEIPDCYADATEIGSPMSPDIEILKSLSPDWVLSPSSLSADLKPKYEAAGLNYAFLNLKSVTGMYKSIEELGDLLDRKEEASALVSEFNSYYEDYTKSHEGQDGPSVLILMGVPGSYVVATENSYVGSLVKMAGGKNIYEDSTEEFISANTEDMLQKNPDIILRTAHALPDEVMEMFSEEFKTNDIWQHFTAVQNGKVYDLTNGLFGMSATFDYPDALAELDSIFYAED